MSHMQREVEAGSKGQYALSYLKSAQPLPPVIFMQTIQGSKSVMFFFFLINNIFFPFILEIR